MMKRNFVALFILLLAFAFMVDAFVSMVVGRGDDKDIMTIEVGDVCINKVTTVKVFGKRDKPLRDVDIDIYDYRNRKNAYGRTNSQGVFEFTLTKVGIYTMEVEKSGYETEEVELNASLCASTTTSTTTSTVSTTTISPLLTTTTRPVVVSTTVRILPIIPTPTIGICNKNALCEPARGENYKTCPSDCPTGRKDGYCDRVKDGLCDPDCYGKKDPDCICDNNNICDGHENYKNCRRDCPSGGEDNYCDAESDGRCDPDCPPGKDPDCKQIDILPSLPFVFIVLLVFGALVFYGMRREIKRRAGEETRGELIDNLKEGLRKGEDPDVLREELIAKGLDPKLVDKAERGLWG
ncbi:MAG: carboxypeptidase-like regulatory domain-containing protein [Candidatus Altiarchaeota archaeon]|nr:carboxypeptidase-like regulatory domain-containing protein [Candidatus Altiarchaeota archaeon]